MPQIESWIEEFFSIRLEILLLVNLTFRMLNNSLVPISYSNLSNDLKTSIGSLSC